MPATIGSIAAMRRVGLSKEHRGSVADLMLL